MKIEIVRPDDLLNLRIEAVNLRLDATMRRAPVLVVADARQPAYLVVTFPPQTIAEHAYFEAAIVQPEADPLRQSRDPEKGNNAVETPAPPGQTAARLGQPSRLVFQVPPAARIPYSVAGLLDWSGLTLNVHPIAAIGRTPTAAEIANAPVIAQPAPTDTALELPYRLVISPNRDAHWNHRLQPFTQRGRTELWHTRLMLNGKNGPVELSRDNTAPLRAIWSQDYSATNPPPTTKQDAGLGRTAMSPNDRHQIVILTSAFHGYEGDIELNLMPIVLNPLLNAAPEAAANSDLATTINAGLLTRNSRKFRFTVPYVPKPFEAEQVMLTPLGGWLRSRGAWDPPRKAKPVVVLPPLNWDQIFTRLPLLRERAAEKAPDSASAIQALHDEISTTLLLPGVFTAAAAQDNGQLDLSEWVHVATQGRDHYVRIVYEGELWPFRHRAALIKVTERKFKQGADGVVGAYLFQRMFIVVREPVKTFDVRGNPFKRVRLTTLVTPDIAEPQLIPPGAPTIHRSFWVEVMTGASSRDLFRFHAVGTDVANNSVDFTIPLMFVSISDLHDAKPAAAAAVEVEYNSVANAARRTAVVPGQKLTFADPGSPPPGGQQQNNTQLVTEALNFVVNAVGDPAQMLKADVRIPQVEELLGTNAPTTIRYFSGYVKNGFDAQTGVFAEIVKKDLAQFVPDDPTVRQTLGVAFSSDQAGGFATPNMGVSTLTRALGPLAGKVEDALTNTFNPAEFFKGVTAQLFGSFDLFKLLSAVSLDKNAPKLRTQSQDLPPNGKLLIATLDWEPKVENLDLGIAAFEKDHNGTTKLLIHGRIEKPVTLDTLGAPVAEGVKFDFNGKLNDFQVSILKCVFINFVEFAFTTRSNQKPDVKVSLDPAQPLGFGGDLKFVEELRKAIPPGLFGDGPSLDIAPTGIRAGFAFTLPPIAVGVFALKDVTLGAALTLPFLDGKPVFDFNVSERAHPFLLSVSIFGGGGFFHLQLDTAGMKQLEAALEFGVTAAIDLGVASGEVHIMAGIYFSMQRRDPGNELSAVLTGYLRMGGSLSVLGLIKVSVEFNLSFTYDAGKDKAYGRATLTVQVEVLFFSTSVELTVEKAFGGKSGDPTFKELLEKPEDWSEYALAFA